MAKTDPILQVLDSFIGDLNGETVLFRQGELVEAAHPAVKRWPDKFGAIKNLHRAPAAPVIEEATSPAAKKRGA